MNRIINYLHRLLRILRDGLAHVLMGEIFAKVMRFLASAIIVRALDKSSYGIWTYLTNLVSLIFLFDGFGIKWGVLHFCSKDINDSEKYRIYRFGMIYGLLADSLLAIVSLILIFSFKTPFRVSFDVVVAFLVLQCVGFVFDINMSFLRASNLQNIYGLIKGMYNAIYFSLIATTVFKLGIYGILVSEFISTVIATIFVSKYILPKRYERKSSGIIKKDKFDFKRIVKTSALSSVSSSISQLLYLIDTLLIAYLLKAPNVLATYKVATIIPFNLTFIPISISGFFYPKLSYYGDDTTQIRSKARMLIFNMLILNTVIVLPVIVFSKRIVSFMFGEKYIESSVLMNILLVGYLFASSLRIPISHVLSAMGALKQNLVNAILSGLANVLLDVILISKYGSVGAAVATSSIFILSSLINLFSFLKILRNR
uniref:Membrane protein involved in the export of O-antigen and teichoic acid n=1 Tax=Fervidobacterium pennivorans TaxID=93466 RepID=A0A7V4FHG5_FERPE